MSLDSKTYVSFLGSALSDQCPQDLEQITKHLRLKDGDLEMTPAGA